MIEFNIALIISSLAAGIFTFLAPCTLPLVPAFLGVISGVPAGTLENSKNNYRWKIFTNAIFYVLGFSIIFILLGASFSFLTQIAPIRILIQRVGGLLVILFGLFLLGWIKWDYLTAERKINIPGLSQSASKINAFVIGALFALGWSPCVGPLLGSILFLAASSARVVEGTFLLAVFSLGLALPFLITALLIGQAFKAFQGWNKFLGIINKIAALFLITLGILMVSNSFSRLLNFLIYHLSKFKFYEELIYRFF